MKRTKRLGVNKIFIEILDWVKRFLQFKAHKNPIKPYKLEQTYIGTAGILKLVTRDTTRAVRTYIFTPYKLKDKDDYMNTVKNHYDIHLCLDHLWSVYDGTIPTSNIGVRKQLSKKYTHCITILQAGRCIDKNGKYFTKPILYKEFNFLGSNQTTYRDKFAVPIFDEIAHLLKNADNPNVFDYTFEITLSQKKHMGAFYRKDEELEEK